MTNGPKAKKQAYLSHGLEQAKHRRSSASAIRTDHKRLLSCRLPTMKSSSCAASAESRWWVRTIRRDFNARDRNRRQKQLHRGCIPSADDTRPRQKSCRTEPLTIEGSRSLFESLVVGRRRTRLGRKTQNPAPPQTNANCKTKADILLIAWKQKISKRAFFFKD